MNGSAVSKTLAQIVEDNARKARLRINDRLETNKQVLKSYKIKGGNG